MSNSPKVQNTNFESFISEYKESREHVLNVLKIIIEQNRVNEFLDFLVEKGIQNTSQMKEFIKSKYYEFVESTDNIKECKTAVQETEQTLIQLENAVQSFLKDFNDNFIERIKQKEKLKTIIREKEKLNITYVFFGYLNKADIAIRDQQFELSIKLLNTAYSKFLTKFPITSPIYKRGDDLIQQLKSKITTILNEKLTQWLTDVTKEQNSIGDSLYKKVQNDSLKGDISVFNNNNNNTFNLNGNVNDNRKSTGIRTTKNIVESLLLIRNTSNLNYVMNKNSVLKLSLLNGELNEEVEYDIINMVSNVDLKFLEKAYNIHKSVNNELKFLESFRNYRNKQVQSLLTFNNNKTKEMNIIAYYDKFFSELLGYIVIQVSIYELYPYFYSKRKFEEIMNTLVKDLQSTLSTEFNSFNTTTQYITLERAICVFLNSIEIIGVSQKIGIDIRSLIVEMIKDKVISLNIALISKYNMLFTKMIIDDTKSSGLMVNNEDEYNKQCSQYKIVIQEHLNKDIKNLIYPYKLPYTQFVIDVNENFKHYVNEIFEFVKPLYSDYDGIIPEMVRDFLKKLNEVFILFANSQEQNINVISLAQIANNIKYILQSHNYYVEYVKQICNIKSYITIYSERPLKEAGQAYEEMIYEELKQKIRKFLSDLTGENWIPTQPRNSPGDYIEGMIAYLNVIYMHLLNLSNYYVETCFKDALKFTSKLYWEILCNDSVVSQYNYYAIMNLKSDIETLSDYFKGIDLTYKDFCESLDPMKNIIALFENKNIEEFIEKNRKFDNFYKINENELVLFLGKYKKIKSSKEMKGKITEHEISTMIKKLKKEFNIETPKKHK